MSPSATDRPWPSSSTPSRELAERDLLQLYREAFWLLWDRLDEGTPLSDDAARLEFLVSRIDILEDEPGVDGGAAP
jgi:hypothetical protein